VYRSRFLPRFLSVWLALVGFAWVILSLTGILLPQYYDKVFTYSQPAHAHPSFALCASRMLLRDRTERADFFWGPHHPPVISNGAGRLFPSHSLLRMRRAAQREISLLFRRLAQRDLCAIAHVFCDDEISLPLSSALRRDSLHAVARHQGRSYRSNYLGQITVQRLDANIEESIFEGFARKSWNGTRPPALHATASSSSAG
jgi:hypothetical protein